MIDWAKHRSRFSHDWLQNSFLQELEGALKVCRGGVLREDFHDTLCALVAEWRERKPEGLLLIEVCEQEMSPRQLFLHPPLSFIEIADRADLSDMAHLFWLKRYGIQPLLEKASEGLRDVDDAVNGLAACLECSGRDAFRRECASILVELLESTHRFAEAMSRLPKTIMV